MGCWTAAQMRGKPGRATEERPTWGYARLVAERLAAVPAALGTGGGELLAGIARLPARMVATESWPPNLELAARRLRPRGAWVIATDENTPACRSGPAHSIW